MQTVIALGFFDGVHLGHGALLARTAALAAEAGRRSVALTFDRSPGKDGRLLTSVEDRIRLIRDLYGIDEVAVLPFTEEFMHLPWDAFLDQLVRDYGAAHLVCGWDYRFGFRGAGDADLLRAWCAARGLGCDVVDKVVLDGITVSSTFLKTLVEAGDTEAAIRYYGHPHVLTGTVQPGQRLGRTLGFPTANLLPAPELLLPRDGVYAVRAAVIGSGADGQAMLVPTDAHRGQGGQAMLVPTDSDGDGPRFVGVCNVGTRPTVDGGRRTVETWLDDFDGDLYGKPLRVAFYRRLRPEQTFPTLEALAAQVRQDRAAALEYFAAGPAEGSPV